MNEQRITILSRTTLLEGWSKVIRVTYRLLRRDGMVQNQDRDMLDRGDGVTVLLYNRERRSVLLLKQPRVIATLRGKPSSQTIEVCNGLMEAGETPLVTALREVEQETGYRLKELEAISSVYASPGASLEIVHLFFGAYDDAMQITPGGGLVDEGEDIELMEVTFDEALRWIDCGIICDARSMLVLQQAALRGLFR